MSDEAIGEFNKTLEINPNECSYYLKLCFMGESHTLRDSEREITRLLKVFPTKFRRATPYKSLNCGWLS